MAYWEHRRARKAQKYQSLGGPQCGARFGLPNGGASGCMTLWSLVGWGAGGQHSHSAAAAAKGRAAAAPPVLVGARRRVTCEVKPRPHPAPAPAPTRAGPGKHGAAASRAAAAATRFTTLRNAIRCSRSNRRYQVTVCVCGCRATFHGLFRFAA